MNIKIKKNTFNYIVLAQKLIYDIEGNNNRDIELYDLYTAVLLGLPTPIKIEYLKNIQVIMDSCEKDNNKDKSFDLNIFKMLNSINEKYKNMDINLCDINLNNYDENEQEIKCLYADIISFLMYPFYEESIKYQDEFFDICFENIKDIQRMKANVEEKKNITMSQDMMAYLITVPYELVKEDKHNAITAKENYVIDANFLAMTTLATIEIFNDTFIKNDIFFQSKKINILSSTLLLQEHYEWALRPIIEYYYSNYINDEKIERVLRRIFTRPTPSFSIVKMRLKSNDFDESLLEIFTGFGFEIDNNLSNKKANKLENELKMFIKDNNFISDFSEDINPQEKSILCREEEVKNMIISLSKKTKSNVILIGDPGVGKTAIVEELSRQIKNNEINKFKDYKVLECNITSLIAGTMYRGMLEEKLDKLIQFLTKNKNLKVILFIDEVHKIVGAGDTKEGSMDVSNMLKPILARDNIKIIGATTFVEYKKFICKDKALMRRFDTIKIYEPKVENVKTMIAEKVSQLEKYHAVKINSKDIDYVIKIAEKEVHNRYFPDKALDVIDYCMAECVYNSNDKFEKKYVMNYIENLKDEDKEKIGFR